MELPAHSVHIQLLHPVIGVVWIPGGLIARLLVFGAFGCLIIVRAVLRRILQLSEAVVDECLEVRTGAAQEWLDVDLWVLLLELVQLLQAQLGRVFVGDQLEDIRDLVVGGSVHSVLRALLVTLMLIGVLIRVVAAGDGLILLQVDKFSFRHNFKEFPPTFRIRKT